MCPKITVVTAQALYKTCGKSNGKERLKRKALRRPRKTDIEGVDVTCWDRLFHVQTAATGKARLLAYSTHSDVYSRLGLLGIFE